jgi:hypothetical protein
LEKMEERVIEGHHVMQPIWPSQGLLQNKDQGSKVDPNTNRITQYRAAVKIAFGVEHES